MSWLLLPAVVLGSLAWFLVGLKVGLDHSLSDYATSPEVPTLGVIYLPIAGASLAIGGAIRHLQNRMIAARRAMAATILCVVAWVVCLLVVLVA
jgi:Na+-driven multidrug efflux pump